MAIILKIKYAKTCGLPGYSSHHFSVSVESELSNNDDIAAESTRLYKLLQANVDEQIQVTGFIPNMDYGLVDTKQSAPTANISAHPSAKDNWRCSNKQKELILKLVNEHSLDKNEVDHLARERFAKGVKQLSRLEASGLIDELLEVYGNANRTETQNTGRRDSSAYKRHSGREAA